jgi:hypothetical protein
MSNARKVSFLSYYVTAVAYPSIASIIFILIGALILNDNYPSEWLAAESYILLMFVSGLVVCIFYALLGLTILLNRLPSVRSHPIFRMITWFFSLYVNGGYLLWVLLVDNGNQTHWYTFVMVISFIFPFVIGFIWSYQKFVKTVCVDVK